MVKHRKRKTDLYEPLCEVFAKNINKVIENSGKKKTNKFISELTGASESTVAKWMNADALPSLDRMYKLADYFEVSVDELLNDSPLLGSFDYKNMLYWDAFRFLYSAVSGGAINVSSIDDYFLKYLISEATRIDGNDSISSKKKESWYKKVKTDFSIPVFSRHFLDLYLNKAIESFAEVAEYDSYATRAKGLHAWRLELEQKLNDIAPPDDEAIDGISLDLFHQWLEEHKQGK